MVVGAAGGGVPLGAVLVLSWCGEVSLGGKHFISFVTLVLGLGLTLTAFSVRVHPRGRVQPWMKIME